MALNYTITRLEKVDTGFVIGIACDKTNTTGKVVGSECFDFIMPGETPPTQAAIKVAAKNYLAEVMNQQEIDDAIKNQETTPLPQTRLMLMKKGMDIPIRVAIDRTLIGTAIDI